MLWFNNNAKQNSIPWTQKIKIQWHQGEGELRLFGEKRAFLHREEGGSLNYGTFCKMSSEGKRLELMPGLKHLKCFLKDKGKEISLSVSFHVITIF